MCKHNGSNNTVSNGSCCVLNLKIMKHFFRVQFPQEKGAQSASQFTHTHTSMHTHTPQFIQSTVGGGDIAPMINIKYLYNDENNTGITKQNL